MTKVDDEIANLKHRVTVLEEAKISVEEHVTLKNDVASMKNSRKNWTKAWWAVIIAGVIGFSKDILAFFNSGPHP